MPLNKTKGGAPSNSFLDQVTIKCYYEENGENKPHFHCTMTGCHESWASPCHLKRVCCHLKEECKFVGSGTRATATLMLAGEALSASPSVSMKSKVSGEGSVYAVSKKAHKDVLEKELNLKVLWLLVMTGPPGHRKRSQVALTWAQLMCWPPSHWVMASSRVSWGVKVDIPAEGSKFPQHENYIQFPKWDM